MKLTEAYTYFFVPFSLKDGISQKNKNGVWELPISSDSIWEKSSISNLEKDILYPYIQEFLQDSINETTRQKAFELAKTDKDKALLSKHIDQKPHYYQFYSIKESYKGNYISLKNKLSYWKKFLCQQFKFRDKDRSLDILFNISNDNKGLYSPKIIYSPLSRVGFLFFCVELSKNNSYTIQDLISLNYSLHKTSKGQDVICKTDFSDYESSLEDLRIRLSKADDKAKDNLTKAISKKEEEICGIINLFNIHDEINIKYPEHAWTVNDLIFFLFDELVDRDKGSSKDKITKFNNTRIHLLTYYQLEDINLDSHRDKEQMLLDLTRITRCQNYKYQMSIDDVKESGICMHTFQNIHFGVSVEGSAILTILPPDDTGFFKGFHSSNFQQRYIWIYIMALMQRYKLLELVKELSLVDDDNLEISLTKLKAKVEHLSKVKVNTYFTDISDYTQHNQYYKFCIKNLHIKEHFDEIDDKIGILNTVISHRIADQEATRMNLERNRLELEKANASRVELFMLAMTCLVIFSVANDITICFMPSDNLTEYLVRLIILGMLILAILSFVVWYKKSIPKWLKEVFKKMTNLVNWKRKKRD